MELLLAIGLAAGTAWAISAVGSRALDRSVGALAALVGGWRPDGWPRGVQEEDRDQPWGKSRAKSGESAEFTDGPKLAAVHGTLRIR